jgi:signal transduction histidine kinase
MSEKEELENLKKTFEDFIEMSGQLQRSYEVLKEESQRLSLYLSNILDNMSSAIMVFDNRHVLNLWNGESKRYFPVLEDKAPPLQLDQLIPQSLVDIKGILEGKFKPKANEELIEMEIEIDGQRKWLEIDSSDFINNKREKTGYLVVINDKTELKKLQLKSQQEDRLRVMGELAAEVAHEIRNPLGSIELMVTLLQEDLKEDEGKKDILARIRTSVDNMNHTVTNILLYTKEIRPDRSDFPLDELVSQAESIALNTIIKKQISVEKQLGDHSVNGDFELLKQSIANILINAAQAVDLKGEILISAETDDSSPQSLKLHIADNGSGIHEDMKEKVFKPFFTTKNTGTGLGLAMVKRVIEAHSGRIYFSSTTSGTTFTVELPI